jgi:hypothetical protein
LGIAFDPAFAGNRYLYLCDTTTSPATHNRVSRFTASLANQNVVGVLPARLRKAGSIRISEL